MLGAADVLSLLPRLGVAAVAACALANLLVAALAGPSPVEPAAKTSSPYAPLIVRYADGPDLDCRRRDGSKPSGASFQDRTEAGIS